MKISKTNAFLIISLGAFLLYANSRGFFVKTNVNNNPLPPKPAQDGSTPTAPATDPMYKNLAQNYRDSLMKGANWSYDNSEFLKACDELLILNDSDLLLVSQEYNKMYRIEQYNTIRRLLDSVNLFWWSSYLKKEELENRLDKLNIQ